MILGSLLVTAGAAIALFSTVFAAVTLPTIIGTVIGSIGVIGGAALVVQGSALIAAGAVGLGYLKRFCRKMTG